VSDLFFDDGEHVTSGQDEEFLTGVLDFGATVFGEQDDVAFGNVNADAFAVFSNAAWAHCNDFSFLWFFLGGIGDDQTGSSGLLIVLLFYNYTVLKRLDSNNYESSPTNTLNDK